MKILHVNASYKPAFIYGGPTMSVSRLCEQLVKNGATVMVYTTTANGPDELQVSTAKPVNVDGVTVIYFKRITKDHTHLSPSLLTKLWREVKNYDLVHVHAWWNLVSVLSSLIAIMRGVPLIVSPRGTLSTYSFSNNNVGIKNIIHQFLGKPLLNRAHVHVTSEREQTAMLDLIKPKSIAVIPNLVKLPDYHISEKKDSSAVLKLIFLSRIDEKKGLDILLNALSLLTVPFHLTIAGSGDDTYVNYLKEIASANQTDQYITWAGFQGKSKFDILRENDLFILPSHDENFGNSVIESLSVGTAVLISNNVGLASYVKEKELGWLCETNPASISAAINKINNDKAGLHRIRQQAPTIIYNDFDPDNLVQKYLSMYNQIAKT